MTGHDPTSEARVASRIVAINRTTEVEVFRAALEGLLPEIDPGGFLSNELGVAWVAPGDDRDFAALTLALVHAEILAYRHYEQDSATTLDNIASHVE